MLKIAIASGTRADWGLLSPLAHELRQRGCSVEVIATNTEGNLGAIDEIKKEGLPIRIITTNGDPAQVAAQTLSGCAALLQEMRPDLALILGDRFEMLGAASAALLTGVPICHIAGGALSEGAFDDSIRHSISKMASLHLVETEQYRQRVIQLGEDPSTVVNTGAIGVHNLMSLPLMDPAELEASLGIRLQQPLMLVTLHAATRDPGSPLSQMQELLTALEDYPGTIIFTYPNNDVDPEPQIRLMQDFTGRHPDKTLLVSSLGKLRYLSALENAACMVGNSSSGIVEAPSAGTPSVNIGSRQDRRMRAPSTIDCQPTAASIREAISKALSSQWQELAAKRENPYQQPGTLRLMADAIMNFDWHPFPSKRFYDLQS